MQHQLPSLTTLLPHENQVEFYEFRGALVSTWQPANAQELLQIDLVASAWWRMARASRYEAELLNHQLEDIKRNSNVPTAPHPRDDRGVALIMSLEKHDHAFTTLSRYSDRATSTYFRALAALEKMQAARRREERLRNRELASFRQTAADETPAAEPQSASFGPAPADAPPHTEAELASFRAPVPTSEAAAASSPKLALFRANGKPAASTEPPPGHAHDEVRPPRRATRLR